MAVKVNAFILLSRSLQHRNKSFPAKVESEPMTKTCKFLRYKGILVENNSSTKKCIKFPDRFASKTFVYSVTGMGHSQ